MKTKQRLLILSCLLVAGSFIAQAQEKKPAPNITSDETFKVTSDETFKVLASKLAFGKLVKGAPYSALATTERVQTLNDGNQIVRKNESKLYRDSEGRTRTEQTLETIGKWTAEGQARQFITINDPVAGASYSLDPHTRTAHKNVYALRKPATVEWQENFKVNERAVTQAEFDALKEKIETKTARDKAELQIIPSKESKPWELQVGISGDPRKKLENLGKQVIEGLEVVGTRSTYTIPAGEIGNTLSIEVVEETWYSPALQLMVLTKSRDPRSGETSYRLTNLNRSEPDRSLFEVPADYTVTKIPLPAKTKPTREDEQ
ncbi:MAG: hypothetical protein ABI977_31440 [Acidobacteriota bacterium]